MQFYKKSSRFFQHWALLTLGYMAVSQGVALVPAHIGIRGCIPRCSFSACPKAEGLYCNEQVNIFWEVHSDTLHC